MEKGQQRAAGSSRKPHNLFWGEGEERCPPLSKEKHCSSREPQPRGEKDAVMFRGSNKCPPISLAAVNTRRMKQTKKKFNAVTLSQLCEEDKQRVRQLIMDLAAAGHQREEGEKRLHGERGQFRAALVQLNQQMVSLEKEKKELQCQLDSFRTEQGHSKLSSNHEMSDTAHNPPAPPSSAPDSKLSQTVVNMDALLRMPLAHVPLLPLSSSSASSSLHPQPRSAFPPSVAALLTPDFPPILPLPPANDTTTAGHWQDTPHIDSTPHAPRPIYTLPNCSSDLPTFTNCPNSSPLPTPFPSCPSPALSTDTWISLPPSSCAVSTKQSSQSHLHLPTSSAVSAREPSQPNLHLTSQTTATCTHSSSVVQPTAIQEHTCTRTSVPAVQPCLVSEIQEHSPTHSSSVIQPTAMQECAHTPVPAVQPYVVSCGRSANTVRDCGGSGRLSSPAVIEESCTDRETARHTNVGSVSVCVSDEASQLSHTPPRPAELGQETSASVCEVGTQTLDTENVATQTGDSAATVQTTANECTSEGEVTGPEGTASSVQLHSELFPSTSLVQSMSPHSKLRPSTNDEADVYTTCVCAAGVPMATATYINVLPGAANISVSECGSNGSVSERDGGSELSDDLLQVAEFLNPQDYSGRPLRERDVYESRPSSDPHTQDCPSLLDIAASLNSLLCSPSPHVLPVHMDSSCSSDSQRQTVAVSAAVTVLDKNGDSEDEEDIIEDLFFLSTQSFFSP